MGSMVDMVQWKELEDMDVRKVWMLGCCCFNLQ